MIDSELLQKEIYTIPIGSSTLFYAPLTRYFCLYKGIINLKDVDRNWLAEAINLNRVPFFVKKGFSFDSDKIKLRVNVTNKCNLCCTYCSIGNVRKNREMSVEMGLNAIRNFLDYAEHVNAKEIEMTFSGGEPTLNISLITKIIGYIKENSKPGIKVSSRILTNGLFQVKELTSVLNNIDGIQISWDGNFSGNPRYAGNSNLAKQVRKNIDFLCGEGILPSILAVISESNYLFINEIVDDLYQNFGIYNISFVFKDNLGRALGKKEKMDFLKLGQNYIKTWAKYRSNNIDINLSGTDIHSISFYPCSMPHPNYSISPEGIISSCTVVFNELKKRKDLFEIGKVSRNGLKLDSKAIEKLRQFNVLNMSNCQKCFAKWHCRGGCIYAKQGKWFTALDSDLCELIRWIIKNKLFLIISSGNRKDVATIL